MKGIGWYFFPLYTWQELPVDLSHCNLKGLWWIVVPESRFTGSAWLKEFVKLLLLSKQTSLISLFTGGSSANANYPCEKSVSHHLRRDHIFYFFFTWYIRKKMLPLIQYSWATNNLLILKRALTFFINQTCVFVYFYHQSTVHPSNFFSSCSPLPFVAHGAASGPVSFIFFRIRPHSTLRAPRMWTQRRTCTCTQTKRVLSTSSSHFFFFIIFIIQFLPQVLWNMYSAKIIVETVCRLVFWV